ncbi:hypothetical protein Anas_04919 [Armadillidium nasatum]|uniref:CCHC-type domain-containing protein n=1 Tax=Armadillidium nasatum TaxID=96803 RepID=A0A5N5SRT7_9CRUS|nr:hypothetical protein Anas_04919 [Armadillidium nasatum]
MCRKVGGASSVSKEDVNGGDIDDKQVKGATGCQEEGLDKNGDANHHNNVQKKKRVVCVACGDKGHKAANCSLLENMEVVECCSKCLSPDHTSEGCSEVQVRKIMRDQAAAVTVKILTIILVIVKTSASGAKNNTDGHLRKDCPTADLCRHCEESNHPSWTCDKKCKYCNENLDGHVRKDCPLAVKRFRGRGLGRGSSRGGGRRGRGSSRGGGFSGSTCYNCNEVGHMSRFCPQKGF